MGPRAGWTPRLGRHAALRILPLVGRLGHRHHPRSDTALALWRRVDRAGVGVVAPHARRRLGGRPVGVGGLVSRGAGHRQGASVAPAPRRWRRPVGRSRRSQPWRAPGWQKEQWPRRIERGRVCGGQPHARRGAAQADRDGRERGALPLAGGHVRRRLLRLGLQPHGADGHPRRTARRSRLGRRRRSEGRRRSQERLLLRSCGSGWRWRQQQQEGGLAAGRHRQVHRLAAHALRPAAAPPGGGASSAGEQAAAGWRQRQQLRVGPGRLGERRRQRGPPPAGELHRRLESHAVIAGVVRHVQRGLLAGAVHSTRGVCGGLRRGRHARRRLAPGALRRVCSRRHRRGGGVPGRGHGVARAGDTRRERRGRLVDALCERRHVHALSHGVRGGCRLGR